MKNVAFALKLQNVRIGKDLQIFLSTLPLFSSIAIQVQRREVLDQGITGW